MDPVAGHQHHGSLSRRADSNSARHSFLPVNPRMSIESRCRWRRPRAAPVQRDAARPRGRDRHRSSPPAVRPAARFRPFRPPEHLLELFSNINDILKWDVMGRYKDISLGKFLTYFLGEEANSASILTQLPLNTDWIELLSARMVTHECSRGGPDLVLPEETKHDYWGSDEHSSSGRDEDNDSDISMFGDL